MQAVARMPPLCPSCAPAVFGRVNFLLTAREKSFSLRQDGLKKAADKRTDKYITLCESLLLLLLLPHSTLLRNLNSRLFLCGSRE
jgi:hypothetical protein